MTDVMAESDDLAHEKVLIKCSNESSYSNTPEQNEIEVEKIKKPMSEFDEEELRLEDLKISTKYKYPGALGGKWLLFFLHEYLDAMWEEAVRLYSAGVLTGIKFIKTSTAVRYSKSSDDVSGVISFACGPCNNEMYILRCGLKLVKQMKYFNACGFVSYKTDTQSKNGTRATGVKRNYLYRLPVATHDRLKKRSALSLEYPIEVPSCTRDRLWLHEADHNIVVDQLTEPIEVNSTARWSMRFSLGTPHDSAWVTACRAYRNKKLPGILYLTSTTAKDNKKEGIIFLYCDSKFSARKQAEFGSEIADALSYKDKSGYFICHRQARNPHDPPIELCRINVPRK